MGDSGCRCGNAARCMEFGPGSHMPLARHRLCAHGFIPISLCACQVPSPTVSLLLISGTLRTGGVLRKPSGQELDNNSPSRVAAPRLRCFALEYPTQALLCALICFSLASRLPVASCMVALPRYSWQGNPAD